MCREAVEETGEKYETIDRSFSYPYQMSKKQNTEDGLTISKQDVLERMNRKPHSDISDEEGNERQNCQDEWRVNQTNTATT